MSKKRAANPQISLPLGGRSQQDKSTVVSGRFLKKQHDDHIEAVSKRLNSSGVFSSHLAKNAPDKN